MKGKRQGGLAFSLGLLAVLSVGCGKEIRTPFDRSPLEAVIPGFVGSVHYCQPDSAGRYSENVSLANGGDEDHFWWGQGGTCILKPIREVWAELHNPETLHWSGVDEVSMAAAPPPERVAFLFSTNYTVHAPLVGDVTWTFQWYHAVLEGSVAAPRSILINYKKVEGTSHIELWDGSIWLESLAPNVTHFAMRNHIHASDTSRDDASGSIQEVITKIRTLAPNWNWLGRP